MLIKRLQELLDFAQETDLQEVVWERSDIRVGFRRAAPPAKPSAGQPLNEAGLPQETPAKPPEPAIIRSTMGGTFYRSDSPDRPPLVVEGTAVTLGQPVAAIEAMKIMKDIVSPVACRIVKALVANGHAVEYGQPLFEVEPIAEGEKVSG
jgi:acetyl-CoA carboxylase biotin carboxyl carrier protein